MLPRSFGDYDEATRVNTKIDTLSLILFSMTPPIFHYTLAIHFSSRCAAEYGAMPPASHAGQGSQQPPMTRRSYDF